MNIGVLTSWRRNALAFALGTLMTLTLAPFFIFPLLFVSFSGLYLLVDSATTPRRRFLDGWWWGWGFYMTSLYWFCVALLTDAEAFAWLIPFALFGLTGVIAIYAGIACWLMSFVRARGTTRWLAFGMIWMLVEYARGHLFTGFPWNLMGYSFGFSGASLQMASLIGVYGLTGFAVLLGSSFALWKDRSGKRTCIFICTLFCIGMGWGQWRLQDAQLLGFVNGVKLRLVQANILQPHKWDPKLQFEGVQKNIALTKSSGLESITHVIWPETAVPYHIEPGKALSQILGKAVSKNTYLISGSLRSEGNQQHYNIWNSMHMIAHDGAIMGSYDKIKLVPFGEFQPLRDFVPKSWMTPVGDTDFSRGTNPHALNWPGLPPLIALICYEAIFPEMSFGSQKERPQMLLTITNDAWFGMSIGPYQHFHMARMRAAEQGVPLVRVANTGISAVVDSYGRILDSLPLGEQGVLDSPLPQALKQPTFFANNELLSILCAMLGLILISVFTIRKP
jgi:apolipoprotein N-acyltransferase